MLIQILILFQFLMVRLKGKSGEIVIYADYYISIPYGAIKSVAFSTIVFQYLDFNSLWCD